MLTSETRIGLTFGQIIASILLIISIFTFYLNLNARISAQDVAIQKNSIDIETLKFSTSEMSHNSETLRKENREEHMNLSSKLDQIINVVKK